MVQGILVEEPIASGNSAGVPSWRVEHPDEHSEIPPALAAGKAVAEEPDLAAGLRNRRMMAVLERIAERFNRAGIPLMALKGAALNLVLYERADARPMVDLDLLIRPEHVERACLLLEEMGCLRGEPLVREDFFPRFYYETDYVYGSVYPVRIDLHVRPFRPLRYSRFVPCTALWEHAEDVRIGRATVFIPAADDMLVHLASHAAIHGSARLLWLEDIKLWSDAFGSRIDWDRFLRKVEAWRLSLPVREAIRHTDREVGTVCPANVRRRLSEMRSNWRDRLALWQAPRDAGHPVLHFIVDVLCTPGPRFVLGYVRSVLVPGAAHMSEWYGRTHKGWLVCAHLLRWTLPLTGRLQRFWNWFSRVEVHESRVHGIGVFATRDMKAGETITRCLGKSVDGEGMYVVAKETEVEETRRLELTSKLQFLNHSCRPNASINAFELVAQKPIRAGQEIFIDCGPGACTCAKLPDSH